MQELVPPDDDSLEVHYTRVFWHFVKDYIFPNWHLGFFNEVDDSNLRGDGCDDAYLRVAKQQGLPLVTDEGNSPKGLRDENNRGKRNLRGKAKDTDVQVFTPGEFWRNRALDPARATHLFFERFDLHRAEYVRSRGIVDDNIDALLDNLRRIFQWILG